MANTTTKAKAAKGNKKKQPAKKLTVPAVPVSNQVTNHKAARDINDFQKS